MSSRFKFISPDRIDKYNGGILRKWDGDKLVKVVSNPDDESLDEFGYKPLVSADMPEEEGAYFTPKYTNGKKSITQSWERHEIKVMDIEEMDIE